MKIAYGNMWDVYGRGLFLITTNSFVKKNGELVMGAGIAKHAKRKWSWMPRSAGDHISNGVGHLGVYGLMVNQDQSFGLFQVKVHWVEPAKVSVINYSAKMLTEWCAEHPEVRVDLNFPGIGNGGLKMDQVLPAIKILPDQVTVWKFEIKTYYTLEDCV